MSSIVHKATELPKEEFKREVEKHLTRQETEQCSRRGNLIPPRSNPTETEQESYLALNLSFGP